MLDLILAPDCLFLHVTQYGKKYFANTDIYENAKHDYLKDAILFSIVQWVNT